eukprot:812539_1
MSSYDTFLKPLIRTQCVEFAKQFFINGYYAEKSRLNNIHNECAHHKYSSTESFIEVIQYLNNKFKETDAGDENKQLTEEMHDLIGVGCCKKCCLYLISNIYQLTDYQKNVIAQHTYHDKTHTKQTLYCRVDQIEDLSIAANYFVNCLFYLEFAHFVFNQSNLWSYFLLALNGMMSDVDRRCNLFHSQSVSDCTDLDFGYGPLSVMLFQFVRNIKLLNKRHYESILGIHNVCIGHWLQFIQKQLDYGIWLHPQNKQFSTSSLYCCIVIICYMIQYIKTNEYNANIHGLDMIQQWLQRLKSNAHMDIPVVLLIHSCIALGKDESHQSLYDCFNDFAQDVYNMKWNDMRCYNDKCNVQRRELKHYKLYKCKGCRVIRYCSRQCQKHDWNQNKHRFVCRKLRKLRKKKKLGRAHV